eukprot:UN06152
MSYVPSQFDKQIAEMQDEMDAQLEKLQQNEPKTTKRSFWWVLWLVIIIFCYIII